MVKRLEVRMTDDLSGAVIRSGRGETVIFSLDGMSYEIDLTTKNANLLRKVLRPYVEAGRAVKSSRRGRRPRRSQYRGRD